MQNRTGEHERKKCKKEKTKEKRRDTWRWRTWAAVFHRVEYEQDTM
jgi:hypothetical protein